MKTTNAGTSEKDFKKTQIENMYNKGILIDTQAHDGSM